MANRFFKKPGNQIGDEQLQQFHSDEFGNLDIIVIGGKPFFPATECAKTLGYKNPRDAINKHCKADGCAKRDGVSYTENQHGTRTAQTVEKTYISEGNLYRLIIRSKLPAAARFETWIFDVVLPTIRKYGAYIAPDTLEEMVTSPEFAIALLEELQKERAKNAELAPKAKYYDKILQCANAVPISIIAKDYGMAAASFNQLLHDCRVQYKIGGTWLLYQNFAGMGYTNTRTYHFGENAASVHTCWTQKGRLFLYELLGKYEIYPVGELEDADDLEGLDDFLAEMEFEASRNGAFEGGEDVTA